MERTRPVPPSARPVYTSTGFRVCHGAVGAGGRVWQRWGMNTQVAPIIDVANAVQALIEALQPLEPSVPPASRPAFAASLARARRARVALNQWADEQR